MRIKSTVKTIQTICGKTISYLETTGQPNKMHSVEGPAITYPEAENKVPEYYIHGIKYTKQQWKELIAQRKTPINSEYSFDSFSKAIY